MFGSAKPKADRLEALVKEYGDNMATAILKKCREDFEGWREVGQLQKRVKALKEQVSDLEISKAKKNEEFARKERELEHKVGLHRSQVEHEMKVARKEAELDQRESTLAADRKRFEDQMKFHEKRFSEEIKGLKGILDELIKRMPDASFTSKIELTASHDPKSKGSG